MATPTFKTILLNNMTYGVEVSPPGQVEPYMVEAFATRAEAGRWIAERLRLKDLTIQDGETVNSSP